MIWGLNLPGTPRATLACRRIPLLYLLYNAGSEEVQQVHYTSLILATSLNISPYFHAKSLHIF